MTTEREINLRFWMQEFTSRHSFSLLSEPYEAHKKLEISFGYVDYISLPMEVFIQKIRKLSRAESDEFIGKMGLKKNRNRFVFELITKDQHHYIVADSLWAKERIFHSK